MDTNNCLTVGKLADYERLMTAAKEKMQLVVCLFFAPWCMACKSKYRSCSVQEPQCNGIEDLERVSAGRALHPKLEQIAEQNPEVLFIKVGLGVPVGMAVSMLYLDSS